MIINKIVFSILLLFLSFISFSQHYYDWWDYKPNLAQDSVLFKENKISKIKVYNQYAMGRIDRYSNKVLKNIVFPFENKIYRLLEEDTLDINRSKYIYQTINKEDKIITKIIIRDSNTTFETHTHYLNNKNQIIKTITSGRSDSLGNDIIYYYENGFIIKAVYFTSTYKYPWMISYYEYK